MQITRIELTDFRNHQHLVLEDVGRVLIIVGNNAVGKTNVIEALQILSMHESFRRPKAEELVYRQRKEGGRTLITADILSLDNSNTKQVVFNDTGRSFFYNKKERPAKELIDLLPAVLFTPDDLQIIKGPPEQRRDLLDSLGARLSKTFSQIRAEYYKALRHKNSLLRQDEIDRDLLDSWNINLAKLGTSLSKHRLGLFEQMLEHAAHLYGRISGGEVLTGEYLVSWDAPPEDPSGKKINDSGESGESGVTGELEEESAPYDETCADPQGRQEIGEGLYEALFQKREAEIAAKRSLIGPHKDDVHFCIDSHDTRRFASQGQQRSIALALKMAEIEILRRVSGKNPLLLLDDVMSELDATRRRYFVDLIGEASQTVITTTNLDYFDEEFLSRATVVELKEEKEQEKGNQGQTR